MLGSRSTSQKPRILA